MFMCNLSPYRKEPSLIPFLFNYRRGDPVLKALPAAAACVLLAACSISAGEMALPDLGDAALPFPIEQGDETPNSGADGGTEPVPLTLTAVQPSSGPFSGGNRVTVRGSGFTQDTVLVFDGERIDPAELSLVDSHRLSAVVPPGDPGTVDVVVEQAERTRTLTDGYTYNALLVSPDTGSTAGGTLVEIEGSGKIFTADVSISFGSEPCPVQELRSPTRLSCLTPAMQAGPVDVRVRFADAGTPSILAAGAYTYRDPSDTGSGGLSGGPIQGVLNVTVVDAGLGVRLPGALVLVGEDPDTAYKGFTDANGQITFSGRELQGPVTVHAALKCYEKGSIVAFDARDVTLFLRSNLGADPDCLPEPRSLEQFEFDMQKSGEGHGRAGSFISGELIFPGWDEFMYNDWELIPSPREGEIRVAYVFATRASVDARAAAPDGAGGSNRIVEGTSTVGVSGYPFRIFVRPSALAVYALAGIENSETGEFIPYLMGVRRDLVAAPNQEVPGADIFANIPLDRELQVLLGDLPERTPEGPERFTVRASIDLGGEGVIVREVDGDPIDVIQSANGGAPFRFFAQPAFLGSLADARYFIEVGWYTRNKTDPPYTTTFRHGVAQSATPVLFDDLLGIPQAVSPAAGERIPQDRILRWKADGEQPDLHVVIITGGDGVPAWRQIVPGAVRQTPVPDLSELGELQDIAGGTVSWGVYSVKIPAFLYDAFVYEYLSDRYWTHEAHNEFLMRLE